MGKIFCSYQNPFNWPVGLNAPDAFGVELLSPMDDYKKSNRSTKYAIMTIGLTLLMFFLVEILGKMNIHPLQYALVGIAICLFSSC